MSVCWLCVHFRTYIRQFGLMLEEDPTEYLDVSNPQIY
jgi:hypothetical protein